MSSCGQARPRCRFTAPHRRGVAGAVPAFSVRTPKFSHSAASLRAGVSPPSCEICARIKVDQLLGDQPAAHTCAGCQCSSPMAIGVALCSRRRAEPLDLVGRQRVLEEEQAVGLQLLGHADGVDWRDALVDSRAAGTGRSRSSSGCGRTAADRAREDIGVVVGAGKRCRCGRALSYGGWPAAHPRSARRWRR